MNRMLFVPARFKRFFASLLPAAFAAFFLSANFAAPAQPAATPATVRSRSNAAWPSALTSSSTSSIKLDGDLLHRLNNTQHKMRDSYVDMTGADRDEIENSNANYRQRGYVKGITQRPNVVLIDRNFWNSSTAGQRRSFVTLYAAYFRIRNDDKLLTVRDSTTSEVLAGISSTAGMFVK
jgi:hypothetical protein